MKTYIALLRGINVGGKNSLSMKQLKHIFEQFNAENVQTYIQSGNVVFMHDSLVELEFGAEIQAEIKKQLGFESHVLILSVEDLEKAIHTNPFPEGESDPKTLHFGFLTSVPQSPNVDKLNSLKKGTEQFRLIDKVYYLHAPEGVGRSKLAAGSEKMLGVPMTSRNWRTVTKIREMAMG